MRGACFLVFATACGRIGFGDADPDERDPALAAAYGAIVLEDGPLAYFRFAETSGPDALSEVNGVRGQYQGDFEFGAIGAVGDDTVVFDGRTTFIDLGDQFRFAGNAPYTFELWVKPRFTEGHTLFLVARASPGGDGFQFYIGNTYTIFSRQMGLDEFGYVTSEHAPFDRWTYFVATYDGAVARMFKNAVEVSANTGGDAARPIADAAGSLSIGDHVPSQFFKLDGSVDELAIYGYALDPGRIQAHYDATR
jgi:hypothetical protein